MKLREAGAALHGEDESARKAASRVLNRARARKESPERRRAICMEAARKSRIARAIKRGCWVCATCEAIYGHPVDHICGAK